MNVASFPVLLMAAVCVYVGLYYLIMYSRLRSQAENLFFALTCFSIGFYDVFSAGLYASQSVEVGLTWQRLQFAALCLFSIFIAWFIYSFTRYHSKRPFVLITLWFGLLFITGILTRSILTLSPGRPSVKHVSVFGLVSVSYYEAAPGPLYGVQYVSMIVVSVFLIYIFIRHFPALEDRHLRPVLFSFLVFFCASLNDAMVGAGVYPGIYILEYAYMLIILSMSYGLLSTFVDLHNEVGELNETLEKTLGEKTIDVYLRDVGAALCARTLSGLSYSKDVQKQDTAIQRITAAGRRGIAAMSRDIAVLSNTGELLHRIVENAVEASNSIAGRFYIISETEQLEIAAEVRPHGEILKVSERMLRAAARSGREDPGAAAGTRDNQLYLPVHGRSGCAGVVYVRKARDAEAYDEADLSLLKAFLSETSAVVENALLYVKVMETMSSPRKATITPAIEEKIRRAMVYIGENFTSDISREGLAASLSMHPDSLGRFFRMYTGKKIGEYINELRIRKVLKDLDRNEESITQIAFAAGFESIATFNRAFLKVMRITPSEYRELRSSGS